MDLYKTKLYFVNECNDYVIDNSKKLYYYPCGFEFCDIFVEKSDDGKTVKEITTKKTIPLVKFEIFESWGDELDEEDLIYKAKGLDDGEEILFYVDEKKLLKYDDSLESHKEIVKYIENAKETNLNDRIDEIIGIAQHKSIERKQTIEYQNKLYNKYGNLMRSKILGIK